MYRKNWKSLLIVATVAMTLWSVAPQANADWLGWYQPSCGYRCYTPYCSSFYTQTCCYRPVAAVASTSCGYSDSGWYLGWRPGPVRRLLFGPYRWYWGGYSASYPVYSGCCTTVADSCCNGSSDTPAQTPTPAKKPSPSPEPAAPPAPAMPPMPGPADHAAPKTSAMAPEASGMLTVWVPYDAKVSVNGLETKSTGSRRQFVSYGLQSGLTYKYVVKAQIVRDGQIQEDTQTAVLTAGQNTAVAFGFNAPAQQVASAH